MGIFDQLFGSVRTQPPAPTYGQPTGRQDSPVDRQAIERYRYMLETAPPEAIEQAHEEAFAKLTPEQRQIVAEQLSAEAPEAERVAVLQQGASPRALARLATRAEVRNPGSIERTFGRLGGGGSGGLMAGSFLSSIAGAVVGSMIAQQFFGGDASPGAGDAATGDEARTDPYEGPAEEAPDALGGDIDGGDVWDV